MWIRTIPTKERSSFVKELTWEGHAEKSAIPTWWWPRGRRAQPARAHRANGPHHDRSAPLVVYATAGTLCNFRGQSGSIPRRLVADWLVARLNGKPLKSERWFVEPTGRIARQRALAIALAG